MDSFALELDRDAIKFAKRLSEFERRNTCPFLVSGDAPLTALLGKTTDGLGGKNYPKEKKKYLFFKYERITHRTCISFF